MKRMQLVAHRGASLEYPCNSLESLTAAARMGADWVECDVRRIRDGQLVIFHDETVLRGGAQVPVSELTQDELARECPSLMTFEYLCENYREKTPVLLHIKQNLADVEMAEAIARAPFEKVWGVQSPEMLCEAARRTDPEHILAFMPEPQRYRQFIEGGAGVIRLWEHWLCEVSPDEVRAAGAKKVFVMCCDPQTGMNGSRESLERIAAQGADGVLLNDIRMALAWQA